MGLRWPLNFVFKFIDSFDDEEVLTFIYVLLKQLCSFTLARFELRSSELKARLMDWQPQQILQHILYYLKVSFRILDSRCYDFESRDGDSTRDVTRKHHRRAWRWRHNLEGDSSVVLKIIYFTATANLWTIWLRLKKRYFTNRIVRWDQPQSCQK